MKKITLFDPNEYRLHELAYQFEKNEIKIHPTRQIAEIKKSDVYIVDLSIGIHNIETILENGGQLIVTGEHISVENWTRLLELQVPFLKHPVSYNLLVEKYPHHFSQNINQSLQIHDVENDEELLHEIQETTQTQHIEIAAIDDNDINTNPEIKKEVNNNLTDKKLLSTTNVSSTEKSQTFKQTIAAFFSPKGGVGKTVTATNFAALCSLHPHVKRVCLIDLDKQFGNVTHHMGLNTRANLSDFVKNITPDSGWGEVEQNLQRHGKHLYILPAPPSIAEATQVKREEFEKALSVLKNHFDLIVIDMSPNLDALSISAFVHTDIIYVVTTTSSPANQSLNRFLNLYEQYQLDSSKIHLVINRVQKKTGISPKHVAAAFESFPVVATMMEDVSVEHSVNNKALHCLKHNKSNFSKEIYKMMEHINLYSTGREASPKNSGFLKGLFKKRREAEI